MQFRLRGAVGYFRLRHQGLEIWTSSGRLWARSAEGVMRYYEGKTMSAIIKEVTRLFPLCLMHLLVGGFLILVLDVLISTFEDVNALTFIHRFFAPLLPVAILAAALASLLLSVIPKRLKKPPERVWSWKRWTAVSAGLLALSTAGAWASFTRTMQLPFEATVVVGFGIALGLLVLLCMYLRQLPPLPMVVVLIVASVTVTAGPYLRIAPDQLIWPMLVIWPCAALIPIPQARWVAVAAGAVSVVGMWGFNDDYAGNALVTTRSFASAPLAQIARLAADLDGDGSSALFSGGDCDDFNDLVNPYAVEIVGNGLDDNCLGGDMTSVVVPGDGYRQPREGNRLGRLPDVVMISLDAVRSDHLTAEFMPNVHAMTERGLYAPVAYTTAPYTGGAVVSMLTSAPLIDAAVEGGAFMGYEPSLPQILSEAGYRTVAVHCIVDLFADLVQGFELVDNSLGPQCEDFQTTTASAMTEVASGYLLNRDDERPLFLWVHYTDPHLPYIGGYGEEVRRVDAATGRLMSLAREDTMFVIFSDHGESLGEKGRVGHVWHLGEEVLRIVLVLEGLGIQRTELTWPTSLIDIAPTLTELLQLPTPEGWQGRSMLRDPGERPLFFHSNYRSRVDLSGARVGDHKITYDRFAGTFELYDVVDDPENRHNLVRDDPALFHRMRDELGRVLDRLYNDRFLQRKLRLFDSRTFYVPRTIGPILRGNANARRSGSTP